MEKERSKRQSGSRTVYISCSALLREVKLCVGDEHQPFLDDLLKRVATRQTSAEKAVRELLDRVGSTVVQQAGLSVTNLQKGVLPHGWLEYTDDATGCPYYFNVHTKLTTWDKPAKPLKSPQNGVEAEAAQDDPEGVKIECNIQFHNVAMSGWI